MSTMEEDPVQEEAFARAVRGLPLNPHAVHAPPTVERVFNKSYQDPGDRPPDGQDGPDPYWMLAADERHNGLVRCPDCSQVLISAHDDEIARVGFGFLVCWDLHYPYRLPREVAACHEGCTVACGRSAARRA